ncbi:anthranilate synthase component I family protein [Herbiconiux sp.]|uniref:anthranilate synthase component I family protein n=1 Tax=Herbiconiux sp. TaxID=1871186 RepID=UPI0025C3EB86|nr:anthranilate synthase component I family protein [Herbiconiux sp.]
MSSRLLSLRVETALSASDAFTALYGDRDDVFWFDDPSGWSYIGAGSQWVPQAPVLPELRDELIRQAGRYASAGDEDEAPGFRLGLVGWLGYGLTAETMAIPGMPRSRHPDAAFLRVDRAVAFGPDGSAVLLATGDARTADGVWGAEAVAWRAHVRRVLAAPPPSPHPQPDRTVHTPRSARWHDDRDSYLAKVHACQEAIARGDAYVLNLSTEITVETGPDALDPLAVHRRLRELSPSHHAAYLRIGGVTLVSSSPETFLEVDPGARVARTHPVKGTRRRSADPLADARLRDELLASEKERAENVMIVDLMRNDLARVAQPGGVEVERLLYTETFPQVHQLVSSVRARLRPDADAPGLIEAVFPAGSMTGAPKRSAVGILNELEQRPRGLYAGAFGYFGRDGRIDLAMSIRSIVIDVQGATIGVGGGITALSIPDEEYDEVQLKAAALLSALGAASGPVDDAMCAERR